MSVKRAHSFFAPSCPPVGADVALRILLESRRFGPQLLAPREERTIDFHARRSRCAGQRHMTTPGIHALVSSAGQPAAIPPAEIDAIRRAVESGARLEPHPLLKSGDWVRVKCGPLKAIQGILVRKKNLYRLVLSIEMLGNAAAVEVDAFLVERLNSCPVASPCARPRITGRVN
jgi:hypothetical protein